MTVEFVIAFPVMLIVAVVCMNALLFFSECAAFDRLARQAICTYAASPASGDETSQVVADIQEDLEASFDRDWLAVEVDSSGTGLGYTVYTASLAYTPTLAGRSFTGSVFGVQIGPLSHEISLTVDPYRTGAVI